MNVSEPIAIEPSVEQIRGGTARISGTLVPKLMFDLDGTGGSSSSTTRCSGRTRS